MKKLILALMLLASVVGYGQVKGLSNKLDSLPTVRYVPQDMGPANEVLLECYSDDVPDEMDPILHALIENNSDLITFQDTAYQDGDTIYEDIRAYKYENINYTYRFYVIDADGYLQEVLLLRMVKFKQGSY